MPRLFTFALATSALTALPALAVERVEVLDTYADIAEAAYQDSRTSAKALQDAVAALVAGPSEEALQAAQAAWLAARVPYQQTEASRFGNAIVDDWQGKVNAWPLDERLID
jgi:putative iron-regulated protein